jgi:pimeloyl-ACP methyl ester carboxylesterase
MAIPGAQLYRGGDVMKRILPATVFLLTALASILTLPAPAQSQWPQSPMCDESSLPTHDRKVAGEQLIVICIPPDWNGEVVLYAHGYVLPHLALALPVDELTVDGVFLPTVLLAQHFAFITSSYRKNGVAIEQGVEDLLALLHHFKSTLPPDAVKKVYVIGGSEGGLIAVDLLEHHPGTFDAGLAVCAPLGGSDDFIRRVYDFRVVFDYFFPTVFTYPPNAPGAPRFGAFDVPQDVHQFWQDVYGLRIAAALIADPAAATQLFTVTKAIVDPNDLTTTAFKTAVLLLSYAVLGANDLTATAHGIPYDNRSTTYTGSANDATLNAGVERIRSDPRARAYAREFYEPTGNLHDPLVTLHNVLDPVAPFIEEFVYAALVAKKRKLDFLNILPVAGYGHCEFTAQEVLEAFTQMVQNAGGASLNLVLR